MLPSCAESLLTFLNDNSGAISAVAATVGVIIAGVYTFYTTRLWKVNVQLARNAEVQAETAEHHLRLLEQQMALAERTFEAVHRPHLQVEAQVLNDGPVRLPEGKVSRLEILAKNYGTAAATVMSAECSVPGERPVWGHRFLPIVIPPGVTERIGSAILPPTPDVGLVLSEEGIEKLMRWFHIEIRYRGLSEIDYSTKDQISLMPDMDDRTRWTVHGVTPTGPEFWEIHRGKE
jgi:hypothetical protein